MRVIARGFACASLLFALNLAAQNSGPASNGDFQFALSGAGGSIQYNANGKGSSARGHMTFAGAIDVAATDVDGDGSNGSSASNVTFSVDLDCLRIQGNRAAMSGTITSSSVAGYVGVRALLAVEDNGEGNVAPARDRFTWGMYRSVAQTWTPSDAEVPGDSGASFTWFATDAERFDDTPVPARKSGAVDCTSFGFGAYAFEEVALGAGQIQVKP
ncbi:MAG TPA: hypothetical protein VF824_19160 [Thermoanaerobaculia bacterium]|jgi:hypothetical protein